MQHVTRVLSSPSHPTIVLEFKQEQNSKLISNILNISNIQTHLDDLKNSSCKNRIEKIATSIIYENKKSQKTLNEKELKDKLNFIIGGKYQIGDVNLEIKNSCFNIQNTKGFIEFELNKNKTKTLTTEGRAYFEKKSDESDVVEFKLVIDDKGFLNKKSHLIDFFKNLYKRIFGDKKKVEFINTKKELIEQNIENFSKNKKKDKLKNEVKKLESLIKKITTENEDLTEENKILLKYQKLNETAAYTLMEENKILSKIKDNLDSQGEILRTRNEKLTGNITGIIKDNHLQEANEIIKCWQLSK